MSMLKRIIYASFLAVAMFSITAAQDSVNSVAQKSAVTVTAVAFGDRIRITAPASVVQMHVEVYAGSGEKVLDQEIRNGNVFDWQLQSGQRPTAGRYVCVVTIKSISGRLTQKLGAVKVDDQALSVEPAEAAQLSAPQAQAIGPVEESSSWTVLGSDEIQTPTVIAHDGTDGQLTRGRGALTFRFGDFFSGRDTEQMRLTEEGNLGIGTDKPKAKLDVLGMISAREGFRFGDGSTLNVNDKGVLTHTTAGGEMVPNASGTGTQDRVAKWIDNAGTLGDSSLRDVGGLIGLGATPLTNLHVNQPVGAGTSKGLLLSGDEFFQSGNGANNAGIMLLLGVNRPGNRQLWVGDRSSLGSSTAGLFRIQSGIFNSMDAVTGNGLTRLPLNLGTDTSNVAVGFNDFNAGGPGSKLSVAGNLSVGSGFKLTAAPVDGLAVQGNVGIGITNPTSKLMVSGAGGFSAAGAARFDLFNTTANVGFFQHVLNDGRWQLGTGTQTRILVDTAGNLGIGTGPAAAHKLDVAGAINTSTHYNVAGLKVLSVPGLANTFAGVEAGAVNNTGDSNSFFGKGAGRNNTGGNSNSFFGSAAGASNQTAGANSFFGAVAGNNTTGGGNSFFGSAAGRFTTTGSGNSSLGNSAGDTNQTGSNNSFFGSFSDAGAINLSNATAIGHRAFVEQNNSLVLGSINGKNGADTDTNVGIGTTTPTSKLEVSNGEIRSTGPSGGRFAANNPNNQNARVLLDWFNDGTNDWPRIRFGGTGEGSNNGFLIQGPGEVEMLRVFSGGGLVVSGPLRTKGDLSVDGTLNVLNMNTGAGPFVVCHDGGLAGEYASFGNCVSSIRYKTNITPFSPGLNLVRRLRPVEFNWKESGMPDFGLVAEEVAEVEPLLVTHNKAGEIQGVKYERLGVVLINAVKEQQKLIEQLQRQNAEQIAALSAQLTAIESSMKKEIAALKSVTRNKKTRSSRGAVAQAQTRRVVSH